MWYEILPTFGIIVAGIGIPIYATHFMHKAVTGTPFWRRRITDRQWFYYNRDNELGNNNPYNLVGLENIPDEE